METSIRKLKANARNARLSTGPKDTSRSRFNAAKHGILSSRVLIRTGDGKEDEEELEEFSNYLKTVRRQTRRYHSSPQASCKRPRKLDAFLS